MIPRDNEELIEYLTVRGVLASPILKEAFRKADRAYFVTKQLKEMAYLDRPLPIAMGSTISQPYTVAFMLEILRAQRGQKVLDVGAGSGWTTAILSYVVGEEGSVLGTEINHTLVEKANEQLGKLSISNAKVRLTTEGVGVPEEKFDRILVSAAAEKRVPQSLLDQLAVGGRLVIPVDDRIILVEHPDENTFNQRDWHGFVFVPLR